MEFYQALVTILIILWLAIRLFRIRLQSTRSARPLLEKKYPPIIAETGDMVEYPQYPHTPYFTATAMLFEQSPKSQITVHSPSQQGFQHQGDTIYVYCGACGRKILATDNFCPFCGAEQRKYTL